MNGLRQCCFRLSRQIATERSRSPMPTTHVQRELDAPSLANLAKRHSPFSETPLIFDTHKMVSYLKASGFSQIQSEAVSDAMVRVSQHANRQNVSQMVTKSEFVSLRSELSILEKADFALLKTDINAIEKRMETSVAEIYTAVERVENRLIKWVIAVAGAIGLAIVRFTTTSSSGGHKLGAPPPPSNVDDKQTMQLKNKGHQVLHT